MNPWDVIFLELAVILATAISTVIFTVIFAVFTAKKKKLSKSVIPFVLSIVLLGGTLLFVASHPTYYKYNDWAVLGQDIHEVRERYGEFDFGEIREGRSGEVGYYIYTDNGPIMPDHLLHYYWIMYDEHGVVYEVYDGCQKGG